jgi:hypothetical protein
VLVPTLRHGDVVILDNLAIHKQPAVQAAIERAGRECASWRRTPLINPIEVAFAKLEAF